MKKLLLITDSLGLPRLFPEKTEYEDTYPNLLKKHFIIMQYSKGGGTIIELYEQTGYFKAFEPDVIILQSGIVDCAPRPYPYWLQQMSKYSYLYMLFKDALSLIIGKNRLRRIFAFRNTSINQYRKFLRLFKSAFPSATIYALGILPASPEYEKQLRGITKSIISYNKVLEEEFGEKYICLEDFPLEGIMSDHHHLNKMGHEYVYRVVMNHLGNK